MKECREIIPKKDCETQSDMIKTMYMDDLIREMPILSPSKYSGELIRRFSHAHMKVNPDKDRMSMDDLNQLLLVLTSGDWKGIDESFDIMETAVRGITNNGGFEGILMLSDIPSPLGAVFAMCMPVDYFIKHDEIPVDGDWLCKLTSDLYRVITDHKIITENSDNVYTTMCREFSLLVLLRNMYQSGYVTDKWYDSLQKNRIGAGVSLNDVTLVSHLIWDIFSNRESRLEIWKIITRIVECKNSSKEAQDQYAGILFNPIRHDLEYYIRSIQCGIASALTDNDTSILQEIITELFWEVTSKKNAGKGYSIEHNLHRICLLVLSQVPRGPIGGRTPSLSNSNIAEAYRNRIIDVCEELAPKLLGNPGMADSSKLEKEFDKYVWYETTQSMQLTDDNPLKVLSQIPAFYGGHDTIATEAVHKDSPKMNSAEKNIYKAYKTYKSAEEKVDSQLTKAARSVGKMVIGDTRTEVIEGKKYTVLGVLKKALATVALFSTGKIRAIIALVVRHALRKKSTESEKRKVIMELQTEIDMITEKIEDARGDGNREAKYAMMRTKKDLENALKRVQYGMEADSKTLQGAKSALDSAKK